MPQSSKKPLGLAIYEVRKQADTSKPSLLQLSFIPTSNVPDDSNTLLNQLHLNVVWSERVKFCTFQQIDPQYDEWLGLIGDIQVFARCLFFL
ncbi:hypothetical protein V1511DRAFT_507741 [Dipodascopsis uninucleata]